MKFQKNVDDSARFGAGYRWLVNWFSPFINNKKVLDVGCWSGVLEKILYTTNCKLTGIDIEEEALEDARKQSPKYTFVKASILETLPFQRESFDVALFLMTIEHLPEGSEGKALSNINRVLKRNGALFLSTMNNNIISNLSDPLFFFGHRHYSVPRLKNLLAKSGFRIEEYKVHGGTSISVYTLLFYFYKHVLNKVFYSKIIDKWMEKEYSNGGFMEIKIRARKINDT